MSILLTTSRQELLDHYLPPISDNSTYFRPAYTLPPPQRGKLVNFYSLLRLEPDPVVQFLFLYSSQNPSRDVVAELENYCQAIIVAYEHQPYHLEIEDWPPPQHRNDQQAWQAAAGWELPIRPNHARTVDRPMGLTRVRLEDGNRVVIPLLTSEILNLGETTGGTQFVLEMPDVPPPRHRRGAFSW